MKELRLSAGLALLLAGTPLLAQDHSPHEPANGLRSYQELESWRARHGDAWRMELDRTTGRVEFLYGGNAAPALEPRSDADFFGVARLFAEETFGLHGIESATLVDDRIRLLPLGLVGSSDKMTMRLRQEVRGVPVLGGALNVLTDLSGRLLSVQTTALPGLADFPVTPSVDERRATATAVAAFVGRVGQHPTQISAATLGIAGVLHDGRRLPHLVWEIDVQWYESGHSPAGTTFRVDAHSGAIVGEESSVHHFDVGGTVSVMATPGTMPDIASNPPAQEAMPFVRVQSSAGTIYANANGTFNYPGVNGPLNCTFTFVGPYANVVNTGGSNYSLVQSLTGTSNQLLMNPSPTATVTAQANAYTELVRLRNWIRSVNPTDGTADFAALANCAVSGTCNAFFNGSSVNFYNAGGGCVNTAYSSVVAHEMGHWLNVLYGTGNGSDGMGEGNADVFSMYLYDDPVVGRNFTTSGGIIRTGLNMRQFCGDCCGGCHGGVHASGEVWMGAAWKVRANLQANHGTTQGGAIANALFLAWMNSYNQTQIRSVIETQWLTLDDNNGNINDGTPNFVAIDSGFRTQGFPGVDLEFISFQNVTQLPNTQNEFGPYVVSATILPNFVPPITTATLRYRVGNGSYQTLAMSPQGGNVFSAAIPGIASPAIVSYYLTANDNGGNSATFPAAGSNGPRRFFVGEVETLYFNDFEIGDAGWTHNTYGDTSNSHDDFQRGLVYAKGGDPGEAVSGLIVWGNDLGPNGWNGLYQTNQHNWLRSPQIPTNSADVTLLRFQRWLTVERGTADQATLRVNGTAIWTNPLNADLVDTAWTQVEYDISSIASGSAELQIEFALKSNGTVSFGGWTIDDVEVVTITQVGGCITPFKYGTAKVNSLGLQAELDWFGTPSVTQNNFRITMDLAIPTQPGLLYWGPGQASVPFYGGLRLVSAPITRQAIFQTNILGISDVAIPVTPDMIGATRYYQKWYRDPADAFGASLSDALRVTFCD